MSHIIQKFLFRQRNHVEYMKAQSNKISCVVNSRFYSRCGTGSSPFAQVKSPCLMFPTVNVEATGERKYSLFNPVDKEIIKFEKSCPLPKDARCVWSSQNWLCYIDPSNCWLYLWNPFLSYSNPNDASNAVIKLPSVETLPWVAGVTYKDTDGDIIDKFILHSSRPRRICHRSPQRLSEYILRGLAFSTAPSISTDNNDCTVIAIQGKSANLAYCRLGDTTWTSLEGPLAPYFDITYSINHQLFYAMGNRGVVEAWDLHDFSCVKRIPIDNYPKLCELPRFGGLELAVRKWCPRKCYAIESLGDLLMVVRYFDDGTFVSNNKYNSELLEYQTLRCDVYKLDNSVKRWNYIKSLGDRAIFLGLTNTFIVRAQDYPGVRPNSIYFTDDHHCSYQYEGHDVGLFKLDDNSLEAYHPLGCCLRSIKPPPVWVVPNQHLTKGEPKNVER